MCIYSYFYSSFTGTLACNIQACIVSRRTVRFYYIQLSMFICVYIQGHPVNIIFHNLSFTFAFSGPDRLRFNMQAC